jgi:hypothetical protein
LVTKLKNALELVVAQLFNRSMELPYFFELKEERLYLLREILFADLKRN